MKKLLLLSALCIAPSLASAAEDDYAAPSISIDDKGATYICAKAELILNYDSKPKVLEDALRTFARDMKRIHAYALANCTKPHP